MKTLNGQDDLTLKDIVLRAEKLEQAMQILDEKTKILSEILVDRLELL